MSTLPKQSGTSEGSKFTSLVHSKPEPEVSKVLLDEGKAMEVVRIVHVRFTQIKEKA